MKLKIGRSFNLDSKTSESLEEFDLRNLKLINFIGIRLFIIGNPEIHYFNSLEKLLQFGRNLDNFFSYMSIEDENIYVLEKIDEENIIGSKNIYNISLEWNLFINSKNNIVVQQNKQPITTAYFRNFPTNENFLIHLSYLYYCVRNNTFENKEDIKAKFKSLLQGINEPKQ
ncbi:hypothetical protein [Flavobacterium sp. WC2509]|uniref:hypothetical protein n=1 Tax=Flavobacterium sp. WC2509 TaxID=3461406 RepID=UPI00404494F5